MAPLRLQQAAARSGARADALASDAALAAHVAARKLCVPAGADERHRAYHLFIFDGGAPLLDAAALCSCCASRFFNVSGAKTARALLPRARTGLTATTLPTGGWLSRERCAGSRRSVSPGLRVAARSFAPFGASRRMPLRAPPLRKTHATSAERVARLAGAG
jgi:hypothetical protein